MSDRAREIVGLMTALLERARELTAEHKRLMLDFDELQRELDQITSDQKAKHNRIN